MTYEITLFNNMEFGNVRALTIDGEPWFVGKDVANALGYKNTNQSVKDNTADEDRRVSPVMTPSGVQEMVIINESGLYDLIFGSRLESAKKFRHWVTSEVLPSLRKNGGYVVDQDDMSDEELMSKALDVAHRVLAEREQRIKQMQPKVDYFDRLVDSKLLTTFRDCAKEFNMKPQDLTDWLRENGYIYNDKRNMIKPYQPYVQNGLFALKDFNTPYGYSNVQTFITVKGKETFRLLLGI